jgi:hypothetical protein
MFNISFLINFTGQNSDACELEPLPYEGGQQSDVRFSRQIALPYLLVSFVLVWMVILFGISMMGGWGELGGEGRSHQTTLEEEAFDAESDARKVHRL